MNPTDRRAFFKLVFGTTEGLICIATMPSGQKVMHERYFEWPADLDEINTYVENNQKGNNVYFCPQILNKRKRQKISVDTCPSIWADLDDCEPENLLVEPSIVVESSPDKYQAFWIMETPLNPREAEDLARKIAYKHADQGADRSGWDLSQLLRVPDTFNFKYTAMPQVKILSVRGGRYRVGDFEDYPQAEGFEVLDDDFPKTFDCGTADEILSRYVTALPATVSMLLDSAPTGDWSRSLWQLLMLLAEAGLSTQEMYVLASTAACNKWVRDGRPRGMWKDVLRAFSKTQQVMFFHAPPTRHLTDLLTPAEVQLVLKDETFVERYIKWASTLGDAAVQYHQAGAFVLLSSLIAGPVKLRTSFGPITPNLWFMILADTTLTRKTTAMDIATDLLIQVDADAVLATDGSVEGLLTGLQGRPGRPSLFLRDEVSGLLESMTKKDYMAGMAEALTKLYDGKLQKRMLRKEVIVVKNPVLIFFAGGIRTRVCAILSEEWIQSGFMPRFVIITAESDISKRKPIGPETFVTKAGEDEILSELRSIYERYHQQTELIIDPETQTIKSEKEWGVTLTSEAWARWNKLDEVMANDALKYETPDLAVPMAARLAISILKASVLIAASRLNDPDHVYVDELDIMHAVYYCMTWRNYSYDVIRDTGKTSDERRIQDVFRAISKKPGVSRSEIMRRYRLQARVMDGVVETLTQRAMIVREKAGKGECYTATTQAQIPILEDSVNA